MTRLSINLNKIALLRNQRDIGIPSVIAAARSVIAAGAHGITVHPRPDERHIRRSDVYELAQLLADETDGSVEYNIEGYPDATYMRLVQAVQPTQATLVPDAPGQKTSDHGWDIARDTALLREVIADLQQYGVRVSLFVDAEIASIEAAAEVGAERVELYTGPYAMAFGTADGAALSAQYQQVAEAVRDLGLGLNAGHDLNLDNLPPLHRAMPWLAEVSIGHAFTADALDLGLTEATRAYLQALQS